MDAPLHTVFAGSARLPGDPEPYLAAPRGRRSLGRAVWLGGCSM
jgi:hypothetical protein